MMFSFDLKNKKNYFFMGFVTVVLLMGLLVLWFQSGEVSENENSDDDVGHSVEVLDLSSLKFNRNVSSTGRVHSFNEAELSAEQGGLINRVDVSVGEMVSSGRVLVSFDAEDANNQLVQAETALLAERFRLEEMIAGERPERISILQSSVKNAEIELDQAVRQADNAIAVSRKNLFNNDLRAYMTDPALGTGELRNVDPPVISGVYRGHVEGDYRIRLYRSGAESGYSFRYVSPDGRSGVGTVNTRVPQPLGEDGLYILFPENFLRQINLEWFVPIPNDRSPTYISARDAYERALEERDPAIERAEENLERFKKELALVESGSREEHIEAQRALVRRAEAAVASAQNFLDRRVIRAPFDGEVVSISARVGENVSPGQVLVTIANENVLKLKVFLSPDKARLISQGNRAEIAGEYSGTVIAKASGVDRTTGQVEV